MIRENGIYRELTEKEIAKMEEQAAQVAAIERKRPLSEGEVLSMLLKSQVNTLEVDDQTALRMQEFYPAFEDVSGTEVPIGFKFTYDGKLYKTAQAVKFQEHYPPGTGTESLYTVINETYDGSKYDPVPYEGNMALEEGLHYTQNGVLYRCTRSTGNPVYNPLGELVNIYVEVT